jgi:hypothetical protein
MGREPRLGCQAFAPVKLLLAATAFFNKWLQWYNNCCDASGFPGQDADLALPVTTGTAKRCVCSDVMAMSDRPEWRRSLPDRNNAPANAWRAMFRALPPVKKPPWRCRGHYSTPMPAPLIRLFFCDQPHP